MIEEDLYDEMILPTCKVNLELEDKGNEIDRKRYSVYIGNFTWWTTDQELQDLVTGAGVTDLISIQIHDNPLNGLSKGYATVTVESSISVRLMMTKLQDKTIHNRRICVDEFILANMEKYENAFDELLLKKINHSSSQPPISGSTSSPITTFALNLSFPPPAISNALPSMIGIPPVYIPIHSPRVIHTVLPNTTPQLVYPPNTVGKPQLLVPAPNCIPVNRPSLKVLPYSSFTNKKMLTKEEFDEIFSLNRAVVERSMERATQDAEAGLYTEAIETLVTAISLIKESRLGSDSQGVALMKPLQDLLHEIEKESLKRNTLREDSSHPSHHYYPSKNCQRISKERSLSPHQNKKILSDHKHKRSVSPYGRQPSSLCKSPHWREMKRNYNSDHEKCHRHDERQYRKKY